MILLNPKKHVRKYSDNKSRDIMLKTIEFFENKGLRSVVVQGKCQGLLFSDFVSKVAIISS